MSCGLILETKSQTHKGLLPFAAVLGIFSGKQSKQKPPKACAELSLVMPGFCRRAALATYLNMLQGTQPGLCPFCFKSGFWLQI